MSSINHKEIAEKIKRCRVIASKFKIGKTGQALGERLLAEDYAELYDAIDELHCSSDSDEIDELEKYLIKQVKGLSNCDNEQEGGGKMTRSKQYCVYLVYKKK